MFLNYVKISLWRCYLELFPRKQHTPAFLLKKQPLWTVRTCPTQMGLKWRRCWTWYSLSLIVLSSLSELCRKLKLGMTPTHCQVSSTRKFEAIYPYTRIIGASNLSLPIYSWFVINKSLFVARSLCLAKSIAKVLSRALTKLISF